MLATAIPVQKLPDTSSLTYAECDEPFVDIAEFSNGRIIVDMKYYTTGRNGAINKAYLRLSVAEMLTRALERLPFGYRFKIYDAWRPHEVQLSLFDEYLASIRDLPENSGKSDSELYEMAKRFVSLPDRSKRFAYVHSSGGAVDITLTDDAGVELDMGCAFDDFSPLAATAAFESEECQARDNRRILYNAMLNVGFTNYPSEWWHYDFGDLFWGATTQEDVRYPSVYSIDDVLSKLLVTV